MSDPEKLANIRFLISEFRSGVSALKVGTEYTLEELELLVADIEYILERE